ncbi:peptidyl-prolyl cis-trans isomerase cyclophilin type [Xylanimonas cellulosilytica DSM 15894]|uniref:Peptidyl-prolyl cis-trans isomerase n=1 Tax=Xylanimonas cellulosilytica (strain DSM 15894 / JCM 12276 / CECT 5975 / KCTC 9989 / LMG 20990 / NBRC 107835 / XIL07) TaxID=446471 RepID=D1BSK9_XYLCX|nr:peptidylprolyl isomerase [Xylanimonas cellulosilytica]ACZ30701.1 peptidyl-prolyl cis-trans isomerase cyclophilin type [Xylanimonas cellulosilytica DSM 15894]
MAPTQREREAARKRQAKADARRAAARARKQRLAGFVAIAVVVGLVGTGLVASLAGGAPGGAADAPTSAPDPALAEGRTWTATIATSVGDITVELFGAEAPQAVANFVTLAQDGFFDDTSCHRLVTSGIYVLQCGDPTGTGTGGPAWEFGPIENAPADDVYPVGTLAMARRPNDGASMGSQFFLVHQDSTIPSDAAGGYTVFGRITSGLDVVQAVADAGVVEGGIAPAMPVTIEGVETQ